MTRSRMPVHALDGRAPRRRAAAILLAAIALPAAPPVLADPPPSPSAPEALATSDVSSPLSGPLPVRNYNPALAPLLAMPADGGSPGLRRGEALVGVLVVESNSILSSGRRGSELLFGDLEITRLSLTFGYGLTQRLALVGELPLLVRWGGVLDRPIEIVERVVDRFNPLRDEIPRDDVRFLYDRDGARLFDLSENAAGLGDTSLGLRVELWRSAEGLGGAALRAIVELPTGDERELFGNGDTDAGLALDVTLAPGGRVAWHGSLSVTFPGDYPVDAGLETQTHAAASLGLEFALSPRVELIAQLGWYGSPIRGTRIPELRQNLAEISAGARWRLSESLSLTVGGVENLVLRPAADFSLFAALERRF